MADEIKKDDELKENMRRHVDELHKEEDGAKQAKSGNFSIFLFALVCACLVGTWWMSAEQQHRRTAAQDIVKTMHKIKASTLMVFTNPSSWAEFPVGSKIVFTKDFVKQTNLGNGADTDYTKYAVVHTPQGLFIEYQGTPTERGIMRELTAMNEAEGLYKTASMTDGYYNEGGAAPVYMLIKAEPNAKLGGAQPQAAPKASAAEGK